MRLPALLLLLAATNASAQARPADRPDSTFIISLARDLAADSMPGDDSMRRNDSSNRRFIFAAVS